MSNKIESHLVEDRVFKPAKEFSAKARISSLAQYKKLWQESVDKPNVFWAREAKELSWRQTWTKVLDWKAPDAKWFVGGKLNVCENCVDRHAAGPAATRPRSYSRANPATSGSSPMAGSSARSANSRTCCSQRA